METIVRVISEEVLTPSSQTPHHLKNHKLSLLDKIQPPVYIPLIFFYEAKDLSNQLTHAQVSEKLKQSLSNTLTAFYPLAGRFDQENFVVDCNDAGVKYVEAQVHARISDLIQDPSKEQLKQCLPDLDANPSTNDDHRVILAMQINFFDCGGVAIGVCLLHYIGDIASLVAFMNSWAATCRGGDKLSTPNFNLASYFAARNLSQAAMIWLSNAVMAGEKPATKRFVFDKEKLMALRSVAAMSSGSTLVKDPTRVELVSSFIWKHFIEIGKSKKPNTVFAASQAVSLRKRTSPPHYLEPVFGNCIMNAVAIVEKGTDVTELQDLVHKFRKAIRVVDDEYIKISQTRDEHGYANRADKFFGLLLNGGMEYCSFTSWCRFPVYEVDYGWGKPVWVSTTGLPMMNFIILMDTKDGDGIEAWISTLHDNIESLESYFKLILPSAEMDVNAN